MKFNGINHLAMATRDMDRTIRFWRDLLGTRLVAGLGQNGSNLFFLSVLYKALPMKVTTTSRSADPYWSL